MQPIEPIGTVLADIPAFVFVLFFVFAAVLIVLSLLTAAKRRKELQAWADSHGLRFDRAKNSDFGDRFPGFKCFHEGHSRYGCNFLTGSWEGRDFCGFDYHYTTGSGKNQSHHSFSGVILGSSIPLRPLQIRPENFFDKITEFFGYDDIDFESAEFSRKFYVKAFEKRWAYDVLHARAIEFLLTQPKFTIQFDTQCVLARGSGTFKPEQFEQAAGVIVGLLDLLPEYVIEQQKGASSS
jgi:hypothetical protein